MVKTTTDLIAKEGVKPIAYTVLTLLVFSLLGWGFFTFITLVFLIGQFVFFYNPEREPEEGDELAILAPVDGKVKEVVYEEESVKVVIENNLIDPHFIRSPMDITVEKITQIRGLFLPLSNPASKNLNENSTMNFRFKRKKFSLDLQSGLVKVPINFYTQEKEKQLAGKRIGFFGGGVVTLTCPKEIEMKVSSGMNVKAGESLLGFLQ